MIPVSLTIKGLFSYQKEQTIYFDKLLEGQLFGIFGSVGSGKSSILEAIAFALYGEIERLHLRDDRNYNMMNLKSDELLIDFVFSNFDEQCYRFVVRGKRHGKKFDKVNTFERSAYLQENGHWKPLAVTTAEQILGLSYENFRRTIIIPQGKFQEFLQLTDKARTDMLKDIFQLDKFEFFQQTTSLERKNSEAMQRLAGRLAAFEEVNTPIIDQAKETLKAEELQLKALSDELIRKEQSIKTLEQLKQLFEERHVAAAYVEKLQDKEQEYQIIRDRLGDYEFCLRHFKADLQRLDELALGIQKREDSLNDYQHRLKICDTQLMEQQQEFATVTAKYQTIDTLIQKKQDYQIGIQLLALKEAIKHLTNRIAKGKDFVDRAQKDRIHREKIGLTLKEKVKKKKDAKPDITVLSAIKSWFIQTEMLEKNAENSLSALNQADDALTHIDQLRDEMLSQEHINSDTPYHEELEKREAALESQLELLTQEMNHAQLQTKLGDLVAALHDGEACPLCGSTTHPKMMILEDVEQQVKTLKEKENKTREALKALQSLRRQLDILEVERSSVEKNKVGLTEKYQTDKESLQQQLASFSWEGYDSKNSTLIDEQLNNYKLIEDEIDLLEEEINANDELLKKTTADRDQYEAAVRKIIEEERSKAGSLQLLLGQLKVIPIAEIESIDFKQLEEKILSIDNECSAINHRYEVLQQELLEQQQLKLALETRFQAVIESLSAEKERLAFMKEQVQRTLNNSKFASLKEVTDLLALDIQVEETRNNMERFFQQLYNAKDQYNKLKDKTAGLVFEEETFIRQLEDYQQFREIVAQAQETYVASKSNLERMINQLEQKQQLQKDLQQLQQRANNLNTLKNLFKGSGFVSYISSVYLQQLCEIANRRFYKLTQQQLRLEVTDKNEFQVRDYLNDGKTRLAKTLSGGQIFQASLSLALALAESIQQQHKAKQNFFFLDEGFGSLDKESLAVAFDTLKTLRNEHRIVGIISHVEELQQEIDVFLQVKNDPLHGTKIKGNWESY
ncbi:SMC family ATPase [Olivibacter ginsenosidimutans]|uniref:SMC family ATPase n=1 Tax=Olivibacter ginsenosidimutans TaxID=1176537 RepID=A0ABP9BEN6_9SPHI